MNKQTRIEALLNALAVLAAELGPLFIHSQHGQVLLQTSVTAVSAIGSTLEAEAAATAPAPAQ